MSHFSWKKIRFSPSLHTPQPSSHTSTKEHKGQLWVNVTNRECLPCPGEKMYAVHNHVRDPSKNESRDRPKFSSGFGFGAETSSFTLSVLVSVAAVTDSAEFRYRRNWSSSFGVYRNYCNLPKPCPNNDCKRPHEIKYSNYRQLLN